MKATIKSCSLTQNSEIVIVFADAQIISRKLVNNNYTTVESDTTKLSLKEWRRALHNVVKGSNICGMAAQDAINVVLDSANTDRRIAAATSLHIGSIVDIEAVEYAAGETIAEGYVAEHDAICYNIKEITLSVLGNNLLKLQWAQTMGLTQEFIKML